VKYAQATAISTNVGTILNKIDDNKVIILETPRSFKIILNKFKKKKKKKIYIYIYIYNIFSNIK